MPDRHRRTAAQQLRDEREQNGTAEPVPDYGPGPGRFAPAPPVPEPPNQFLDALRRAQEPRPDDPVGAVVDSGEEPLLDNPTRVLHPPVSLDVSYAFESEDGAACIVAGNQRFTAAAANDFARHLQAAAAAAASLRQLQGAEQ